MTTGDGMETTATIAQRIVNELGGADGECFVQVHSPDTGWRLAATIQAALDDERARVSELEAEKEKVRGEALEEAAKIVEAYGYQIMPDQLTDEVNKISAELRRIAHSRAATTPLTVPRESREDVPAAWRSHHRELGGD